MNFKEKKILITGGSSGIGKALIGKLVDLGATEIAVIARNGTKLDALQKLPCTHILFLFLFHVWNRLQ